MFSKSAVYISRRTRAKGSCQSVLSPILLLESTHLLETSVEDGIRDLVTDLVGVTLSNRLRGEEEAVAGKVRVI
jgi:hypothetical protein